MKLLIYVAYIWHLRGIFVSGRYLAIICEVSFAVSCVLVDIYKNVGSICQTCMVTCK